MSSSLSTYSLHLTIASPKSRLVKTPPSTRYRSSIWIGWKIPGIEPDEQTALGLISIGVVSSKIITLPVFMSTD